MRKKLLSIHHGVMEGEGAYNKHAKLPAGGASLALPDVGKGSSPCGTRRRSTRGHRRRRIFAGEVGLGYLRLGQAATELSGGEAQRIKLATELQRMQRGDTLYVLDEPTTGLHPSDVERLMKQLDKLVAAGNSVIVVEHDMNVMAHNDWIVDIGPGAGEDGGPCGRGRSACKGCSLQRKQDRSLP
jgi:ABC-type phosphonate transport system ATPase subunit